jgi:hypothetical protein
MRRALAAFAALLALAASGSAEAYCRSSACAPRDDGSTDGHICIPGAPDDCGVAIQWRQPCVGFNVQTSASRQIDAATADTVLAQAFAAWTAVDCGGGATPSIQIFDLGEVSCAAVEYNQHAGNANVLVFRDDAWPHADDGGGTADTLALTTVTYDVEKGDIYDADIEVNTAQNTFSTGDTPAADQVDLLSVLTHEVGHFLGLAHSLVSDTTMWPDYERGSISLRHLADDDRQGICATYPPGRQPTGTCTGIPRHGFAPECNAEQTYVSCAAAPHAAAPRAPSGAGWALGAAALAALRARRGSRRR